MRRFLERVGVSRRVWPQVYHRAVLAETALQAYRGRACLDHFAASSFSTRVATLVFAEMCCVPREACFIRLAVKISSDSSGLPGVSRGSPCSTVQRLSRFQICSDVYLEPPAAISLARPGGFGTRHKDRSI